MSQPPVPFPGHDAGAWDPAPCRVVASWPVGHFAENLVVDAEGVVLISLHSHQRIDRYDPASGACTPFLAMPAPVAGLAHDAAGTLWAVGGTLGQAPGLVWRVSEGMAELWAEIGDAVFLNGAALLPDGCTLLVAESMTGRLIAVDLRQKGRWWTWLASPLLTPDAPPTPGANGVKLRDGWVHVSVTARNTVLRAPVAADGAAGALEVWVSNLRADDFAFAQSGAAYVATHPAQSVLRLAADGGRRTIAGPAEGAVGATAVAFGRTPADRAAVYVTTNGGLWAPFEGAPQPAKLLRIDVGESGMPA